MAYQFFAHYRGGIIEELLQNSSFDFLFVGDDHDPANSGIEAHTFSDPSRFVVAHARHLRGPVIWQPGVLWLPFRRDVRCVIYLGSPWFLATWPSALLARLAGKRVLFWSHGWYYKDRGLRLRFKNMFFRLAHAVLVYGNYSKALGIAHGFQPERIHVLNNSLDYDRQVAARSNVRESELADLRKRFFPSNDDPIVVFIGRLMPIKKIHLALEALRLLKDRGQSVNFLIVGEGPDRDRLEQLAAANGLNVHFYGACYDEQTLARLLMVANALVSPGEVGLNAVHSVTYGTPVITHNDVSRQNPEFEVIVPGTSGELFEPDNVVDLARAIGALTQKRITSQRRQAAQSLVDRFYNPAYQRRVIERAISGQQADDLFWQREPAASS